MGNQPEEKRLRARVGVLSANAFTTSALVQELRANRDFQLIGTACTVDELIRISGDTPLDVLVLDTVFESSESWQPNYTNPIGTLREIYGKFPRTQVVSILDSKRSVHVTVLLRMMVAAIIIKTPNCTHDISLAVRYVQRGSVYLCNNARACLESTTPLPDLTEKEIEIALYLHKYHANADVGRGAIARTLHIAEGTLKLHIANLRAKFNVHNDAAIAAECERIGLVL